MRACRCMRVCVCMCLRACVCTPSHVCGDRVYVFKPNELSSRYSRFPTSRLEIRDFAGTIFARLLARLENVAQRDRKLRYRALFWAKFRAAFSISRHSLEQKRTSGKWLNVAKFDDKTSLLSLSLLSRCKNDGGQEGAQDATSSESPVFIAVFEATRFNARVPHFYRSFSLFTQMSLTHQPHIIYTSWQYHYVYITNKYLRRSILNSTF